MNRGFFFALTVFLAVSFQAQAWAGEYTVMCSTPFEGERSGIDEWFKVFGRFDGKLHVENSSEGVKYKFSQYSYALNVAWHEKSKESEGSWYFETDGGKNLYNDSKYKPNRYKGHLRFNIPFDFGEMMLIFPEQWQQSAADQVVKAYFMLTYIADHMGGTVPVNCRIHTIY